MDRNLQVMEDSRSESVASEYAVGVPQGSVLAPISFPIFINDLFDSCNEHTIVSAEDTSKIVTSKDTQSLVY